MVNQVHVPLQPSTCLVAQCACSHKRFDLNINVVVVWDVVSTLLKQEYYISTSIGIIKVVT